MASRGRVEEELYSEIRGSQALLAWQELQVVGKCVTPMTVRHIPSASMDVAGVLARALSVAPGSVRQLSPATRNLYSRSCVFDVVTPGGTRRLFVKQFDQSDTGASQGLYESEKVGLLAAQRVASVGSIRSPEVCCTDDQAEIIAMDYIDGTPLQAALWSNRLRRLLLGGIGGREADTVVDLVRWLSRFHQERRSDLRADDTQRIFEADGNSLTEKYRYIVTGPRGVIAARIIDRVRSAATGLENDLRQTRPPTCYVHGDFTLANMLYSGRTVWVHDYASSGPGWPERDLARLLCDLYVLAPAGLLAGLRSQRGHTLRLVIDSYDGGTGLDWRRLLFYVIYGAVTNLAVCATARRRELGIGRLLLPMVEVTQQVLLALVLRSLRAGVF